MFNLPLFVGIDYHTHSIQVCVMNVCDGGSGGESLDTLVVSSDDCPYANNDIGEKGNRSSYPSSLLFETTRTGCGHSKDLPSDWQFSHFRVHFRSMSIERSFRSKTICYLSRFSEGRHGTVVDITADSELQARLMGMGFFIGTRFQLLRIGAATYNIPFLLAIGETRIAVDHHIAEMILVEA